MAGHDNVSDASGTTTCRRKFKAPSLQKKLQKVTDIPKRWVLREDGLKISDEKKTTETLFSAIRKNLVEHKDPEGVNCTMPL